MHYWKEPNWKISFAVFWKMKEVLVACTTSLLSMFPIVEVLKFTKSRSLFSKKISEFAPFNLWIEFTKMERNFTKLIKFA